MIKHKRIKSHKKGRKMLSLTSEAIEQIEFMLIDKYRRSGKTVPTKRILHKMARRFYTRYFG